MDLNHIAGELVAQINCTYSNEAAAKLVLAALESVQAETVRQTLERAADICKILAQKFGQNARRSADFDERTAEAERAYAANECVAAIRALMETPVPPDPLRAALAGFSRPGGHKSPAQRLRRFKGGSPSEARC